MSTSLRFKMMIFSGLAIATQMVSLSPAHAVPSDREAWRSDKHGVIVYKDAVDNDTYWFVPKIRFEAKANKTVLRSKVLENGKTEYTVRIIPYFSQDLKELVAQNISNIRQDSQLKPVIAKNIGISLPDFGYKFASASVTNFQYLEAPRLLKFSLDPEEAATFDELYQDDTGVNVDFSIAYDGMMTDKFYNIEVTCKDISSTLEVGGSAGVSAPVKGVVLGLDVEAAFVKAMSNSSKGVNIVSKGDLPEMKSMLNQIMNLCFEPVDPYANSTYGSTYDDYYPSRTTDTDPVTGTTTDTTTPTRSTDTGGLPTRRADAIDGGFIPRSTTNFMAAASSMSSRAMAKAQAQAAEIEQIVNELSLDKDALTGEADTSTAAADEGLLPQVTARAKFRLKKSSSQTDNQAVAKQVSLKDTTSIVVIPGYLAANQKSVEQVLVKSLGQKKFAVKATNSAAAPLNTGIYVKPGQQWAINAAFVFNAKSSFSFGQTKAYNWDAKWGRPDGDLYYRIGNGHWTAVNGRSIIESGVIGGGQLQFYVDRSAIFNKIPEDLRIGGWFHSPTFTIEGIAPQFVVQVSGRTVDVR